MHLVLPAPIEGEDRESLRGASENRGKGLRRKLQTGIGFLARYISLMY